MAISEGVNNKHSISVTIFPGVVINGNTDSNQTVIPVGKKCPVLMPCNNRTSTLRRLHVHFLLINVTNRWSNLNGKRIMRY